MKLSKVATPSATVPRSDTIKFVTADGTLLGTMKINDLRLERVFYHVLDYPVFLWDRDAEHYIVDLSVANPPHLCEPEKPKPERAAPKKATEAIAEQAVGKLAENPRWTGKGGDRYTSRFGWVLSEISPNDKEGLPRKERAYNWRLTHEAAPQFSMRFRRKNQATEAIITGAAASAMGKEGA